MTTENEVVKMLRDLGDKIGKTGEEAWPELVNYTVVDGWTTLITGGIIWLFALLLLSISLYCGPKAKEKWGEIVEVVCFAGTIFGGTVLLISSMFLLIDSKSSILKITQPEGYLIKELIKR